MTLHCRELDLKAMLADPIVKAVMEAVRVNSRLNCQKLPHACARRLASASGEAVMKNAVNCLLI